MLQYSYRALRWDTVRKNFEKSRKGVSLRYGVVVVYSLLRKATATALFEIGQEKSTVMQIVLALPSR